MPQSTIDLRLLTHLDVSDQYSDTHIVIPVILSLTGCNLWWSFFAMIILWKVYEFAIEWTPTWQDALIVDNCYFWYGWFYGYLILRAYGPALSKQSGEAFITRICIVFSPFLVCHLLKLYDAMPMDHQYLRALTMLVTVAALRIFDSGPRFKWTALVMLATSAITLLCVEIVFNSFIALSVSFTFVLWTYALYYV